MLSSSAEYALKATLFIAGTDPEVCIGVREIAAELGIPRNYLSKILHELARAGVLRSTRGRGGGFVLSRAAAEIRLVDVVGRFDRIGRGNAVCLLSRSECDASSPCSAHRSWQQVHDTVADFFEGTTLADLRNGKRSPVVLQGVAD